MRAVGLALAAALLVGCTPAAWDATKEVSRVACIIANAELADERIAAICGFAPDAIDFVHRIAGEHRAGVRRVLERPGVCGAVSSAEQTRLLMCSTDFGYRRSPYGEDE